MHDKIDTNIVFSAINSALPEGPAPEWIELIPAGQTVEGRDGRKWVNDDPRAVIDAFNADGRDIVIDTEHATEIKAPAGDPAPAAGWIRQIEERNGAIWGRVEWTDAGAAAVAARQYRYVSPVFTYVKDSGRIVQLLSVGLTNRPNLRLSALNRYANKPHQEATMKELLKALGCSEEADETAALNALAALKSELATARNRAETPDLAKFVPRADYDAALAKAANAEKSLSERLAADLAADIDREIDAALAAGKITPATRDYYSAMCRQQNGLDEFKKFVTAAPVIGDPSTLAAKPPVTATALNADQAKIAEMFGNSAEDLKKYGHHESN
jgi:phage I-like protein